jgi:hypothetical protein
MFWSVPIVYAHIVKKYSGWKMTEKINLAAPLSRFFANHQY